ncbi:hypothetical protein MIR68_010075 [Amoeboaphelidium protococcarum]|nr:hypothetical protein MIR68_010075 [Amoeboaphelidium protococcarum]
MRFEECFWNGNDTDGPNQMLHHKIEQGQVEQLEVLQFCQELATIHNNYAQQLKSLLYKQPNIMASISQLGIGSMRNQPASPTHSQHQQQNTSSADDWFNRDGFGKDEGASLKRAYGQIKSEIDRFCDENFAFATLLRENVVDSLRLWLDESKKIWKQKRTQVDTAAKLIVKCRDKVDRTRDTYLKSCAVTKDLRLQLPSDDVAGDSEGNGGQKMDVVTVQLGQTPVGQSELKQLLVRMQSEIASKEMKYPFMGTYVCVSGKDLQQWLDNNLDEKFRESANFAQDVAQSLLDNDFIRYMGRGKQFVNKDNYFYAWNRTDADIVRAKFQSALNDSVHCEEAYKDALQSANNACAEYERIYTEHLAFTQNLELSRIASIKQGLHTLGNSMSGLSATMQNMCNSMLVSLETVNAEKDLEVLCSRQQFGVMRPPPFVYSPFDQSAATSSVFGVDVADFCSHHNVDCPWIVRGIIDQFKGHSASKASEEQLSLWLQSLDVNVIEVAVARNKLDKPQECDLQQFSVPVLLAVLRRYFMELPSPLLDVELFAKEELSVEFVKTIMDQSDECRRQIITMLLKSWSFLVEFETNQSNEFIECWAPVLIRSNSDHLKFAVQDSVIIMKFLLNNMQQLFGIDMQPQHEISRQQSAISVVEQVDSHDHRDFVDHPPKSPLPRAASEQHAAAGTVEDNGDMALEQVDLKSPSSEGTKGSAAVIMDSSQHEDGGDEQQADDVNNSDEDAQKSVVDNVEVQSPPVSSFEEEQNFDFKPAYVTQDENASAEASGGDVRSDQSMEEVNLDTEADQDNEQPLPPVSAQETLSVNEKQMDSGQDQDQKQEEDIVPNKEDKAEAQKEMDTVLSQSTRSDEEFHDLQ